MNIRVAACAVLLLGVCVRAFVAQEADGPSYKSNLPADHPAIRYGRAGIDDAATRLARDLDGGSARLAVDAKLGVVPALLDRLHVSIDSQMLVFSKTSFQAARISPARPRAIYFSDDVMVACVPGAPTLEIAAIDPVQGPIFYTMAATEGGRPSLAHGQTCLRCHQGPNTAGVPGIYVGSVIPGPTGAPLAGESAIITDHRTPFADRWGGWYVNAKEGEGHDRANAVALNPADPATLVRESRQNLVDLAPSVDPSRYVASTSDIVALMTFEHQTQMTNLITRVGWETRILTAVRREPRARTDRPTLRRGSESAPSTVDGPGDETGPRVTQAMLDADIEDLVEYMLFSGEAPLREPIVGVSAFTRTFAERGPRDRRGRSLRDFDLKARLFRYPLSYMIYSASFDALPAPARERIYRRLFDVLSAGDRSPAFARLSAEDRRAIIEIVRDTKTGLPEYWREEHAGQSRHHAGREVIPESWSSFPPR